MTVQFNIKLTAQRKYYLLASPERMASTIAPQAINPEYAPGIKRKDRVIGNEQRTRDISMFWELKYFSLHNL